MGYVQPVAGPHALLLMEHSPGAPSALISVPPPGMLPEMGGRASLGLRRFELVSGMLLGMH